MTSSDSEIREERRHIIRRTVYERPGEYDLLVDIGDGHMIETAKPVG